MTTASPRPRLNIHAFILGWLCFVTLPGLLACSVPEHAADTPSFRTLSHIGKAVRPEIAHASAPLPLDERRDTSGAKRTDAALLSAITALSDIATGHFHTDLVGPLTGDASNPPYRSRAPPRA